MTEQVIEHLNFKYENDHLFIFWNKAKIDASVVIDDIQIEFDEKGEVSGLEIMQASEVLKKYGITKEMLENIQNVDLKLISTNNLLMVFIRISALNQEKEAAITLNMLQ